MTKSKVEIQRLWDSEWFTPLADSEMLSFEARVPIKVELRKEIYWLVTLSNDVDIASVLTIRADKINAIMLANDGSAASFDPFFLYRKQFFEWALS